MKQIIVTINPQDDERCGECHHLYDLPDLAVGKYVCHVFGDHYNAVSRKASLRPPSCLAAERKLSALVEAGTNLACLWDAEVGKSGENTEASAAFFAAVAKRLG